MDDREYNAVFKLPFKEAGAFFRKKLSIPTNAWDDLQRGQHALGFMSAGAKKAELLADLRGAVQKAIDGKLGLKEFREKFDGMVATHGWSYKGGRNWRSELIWDVNISTAYQAGRWEQFQAAGTEYLTYLHMDGVRNPRPLHVSWNGITLAIDDPWIQTHYPPNGWKCHCRMCRAERAEWARAKANGKGMAPPSPIDPKTGAPVGIDKGWDYNVGQAAGKSYRVLADKFETLPNDISRAWMKEHVAGPAFRRFIDGKIPGEFPVAVLKESDLERFGTAAQTVWLAEETLSADLALEEYRLLPRLLDEGTLSRKRGGYRIKLQEGGATYQAELQISADHSRNRILSLGKVTK